MLRTSLTSGDEFPMKLAFEAARDYGNPLGPSQWERKGSSLLMAIEAASRMCQVH